jgi:cyanophycinase
MAGTLKRFLSLVLIVVFLFWTLPERKNDNGAVVLIGGGYCHEGIEWMLSKTKNRTILVLSSDDVWMYWLYELSTTATIDFLAVPTRDAANSEEVVLKIKNAESILISGGEQSNYVDLWKGTKLANTISSMAHKIPVGGVSAGLAIMGEFYYSAANDTVVSDEALVNPYNEFMSAIDNGFLKLPFMNNIITDSHYGERNRQGRHLAFMARILNDRHIENIKGIGIDEDTALCIDANGHAHVLGKGKCYLIENLSFPRICLLGHSLIWNQAAKAYIIGAGTSFNFNKWNFKDAELWSVDDGKLARN